MSLLSQAYSFPPEINPYQRYSESDFGGVGIWQVPSAHMNEDGNFNFGVSHISPFTRGYITLQGLPWLELVVRYTDIANQAYLASTTGQTNKDKSVDARVHLFSENYFIPDISIGLRDFAGTGLFSSEYINASKHVGPFDLTIAIGWGYMIGSGMMKNPLCQMNHSFCTRNSTTSMGGTLAVGDYFSGSHSALFGGVVWQAPYPALSFKLEYDANDYQHETSGHALRQHSHWNIGVNYAVLENVDVKLAFERGDKLMLGIDLHASLKHGEALIKTDTDPLPLANKGRQQSWSMLTKDLNGQAGFRVSEVHRHDDTLVITGQQNRYRHLSKSIDRIGQVLFNETAEDIRYFKIIEKTHGLPERQTLLSRQAILQRDESRVDYFGTGQPSTDPLSLASSSDRSSFTDSSSLWQTKTTPWHFFLNPRLEQSIGGPENFYFYRLMATLGAQYALPTNLELTGVISWDVIDNMDHFHYDGPSQLPRVRTDIRKYLTASKLAINQLQATQFVYLGRHVYAQAYIGYLESMFGGFGGELLINPLHRRYALGLDVNAVKKRNFNRLFGFQSYGVVTGHLTHYYQLPFKHLQSKISFGRYLAKDWGVTVDLSREFTSGIRLGGFATFTNVTAEKYGEGSFNKGIYLSIPLDLFTVKSMTERARVAWVPLTRDGGQPLGLRYRLYNMLSEKMDRQ